MKIQKKEVKYKILRKTQKKTFFDSTMMKKSQYESEQKDKESVDNQCKK